MPVPTDTFWNIRRLNIVFAISAVALLLVTGWSIIQDYEREWRKPQQSAMAWEAAFTTDKIERALTPEQQTRVDEITAEIDRQNNTLNISGGEVEKLKATIRDLEGERSNLEFSLNNLKAEATVTESQLQDARTAGDTARIAALEAKLNTKSMDKRTGRELSTLEKIASDTEQMFQWAQQIASAKADLADRTLAIADLTKERTKLLEERDRLQKRRDALQPANLIAKASAAGRRIPLLQFVNPSEKVQQIVLPDVLSEMPPMKVAAIDRCTTCHININKKDFTVDKVVTFLEEQAATTNFFNLPDVASGKSSDARATDNEPGPVASPEFWHGWAVRLSPETLKKNEARLKAIAKAVTDKIVTVTFDGQPVDAFAYALAAAPSTAPSTAPAHDETDASADHSRQDEILLAIIKSLYRYSAGDPTHNAAEYGRATAQVVANADEKKVTTARTAAMKYPEEIQAALKAQLDEKQYRLLSDRYRYALVDVVNAARKTEGLAALDPSPVLLAHPRLDLYVDVDSKHSLETVGCTSCHDGSGLETDFVLAAHFPREIWVDEKTGEPVLADQLDATRMDESHHAADLSNMLGAIYPHGEPIPAQVADIHIELASDEAVEEHRGPTDPQNATEKTKPVPYLDPVTGRESRAVSQMTYWIKKYEPVAPRSFALVYHEWDWPMRPFKYLEANCTRCHTDVYDIKEEAPVISEGRQLFTQMGCVNCHQMDSIPAEQNRKVGTDLRHVTAKLSPEYINTWIFAPKSFRPSTKMPHFFMLENNSSDEELRRTRQEARAMTEYIVRTATPQLLKHPIPSGLKGSAEAGKTVFNSIGCLGCHTNLNEVGDKWITTDLTKRLGMKPAEAKALYEGMTYNERQMYVLENLAEPSDGSVPRYADGTATKAGTPKPIFVHHGPELSGIGTKLLAGRAEDDARAFLFDWLKEPRHYSNYTVMPQLRLTDQQIADVTEYLLAQKRTTKSPDDAWTAGLTPVDTPKLIELTAFFLRSQYSIKVASEKADDLATLRQLAFDAWPNNREDKETAAAAIDAMGEDKDTLRMVFLGKKLIGHYGCMSCHSINGTETISSPCANLSDWGQKRIDKLDFAFLDHHKAEGLPPTSKIEMVNGVSAEAGVLGHVLPDTGWAEPIAAAVDAAWPHVDHTRTAWLTQKLKNTRVYDRGKNLLEPRREVDSATGKPVLDKQNDPIVVDPGKPYDKLKMPTFYLTDEEIDSIVTFVISNRDPLVTERLQARTNTELARRIAKGRAIAMKYNCVGCHTTEMNTPPVQQYYKNDEIATKAPPSLRGEGNKIQHGWLFNFLKNVETIRPLPIIHMPSFPLTDDEATALAAYFSAASQRESKNLFATLDPIDKYIEARREASGIKENPPVNEIWPGDDWYLQPSFATAAEKLREWALARDQITPVQLNPALNKPEELAKNYRTLLFKAHFTEELYDAPYPFVEESRPNIDEARFKKGEAFFYEMQCLKCHILGDPSVPGATKAPTAPNLTLTARRLQRRWVRHWVQEPPIIQAGTAMPPFFTGLPIFDPHGQPFPKSQNSPEADVKRVEAAYGNTADEQTALLLDFLYAAGVRNYTGVQPVAAAPAASPGPATAPAATQSAN